MVLQKVAMQCILVVCAGKCSLRVLLRSAVLVVFTFRENSSSSALALHHMRPR